MTSAAHASTSGCPRCGFFGRGQFRGRQLPAERRDLDGLGAEADVREPEPPADDPAVLEQPLDLVRVRVGADVEVLRPAAEQQVADAAADEVGDVVVLVEPVENLQRVRIDLFAGDRVLGARHDHRNGHRERIVTKRARPTAARHRDAAMPCIAVSRRLRAPDRDCMRVCARAPARRRGAAGRSLTRPRAVQRRRLRRRDCRRGARAHADAGAADAAALVEARAHLERYRRSADSDGS